MQLEPTTIKHNNFDISWGTGPKCVLISLLEELERNSVCIKQLIKLRMMCILFAWLRPFLKETQKTVHILKMKGGVQSNHIRIANNIRKQRCRHLILALRTILSRIIRHVPMPNIPNCLTAINQSEV